MIRYARPVVILHWLLALLIIGALAGGALSVDPLRNDDPAKISALGWHMATGGAILILMILRLILRLRTGAPPRANALAPLGHAALYLSVLVMAASGITMSVYFGLPGIVFGGTGPLPDSFGGTPARSVHGVTSKVLMALIAGHILIALWHGAKGDQVMGRMGWGK
jgi:cytochrome b561